MQMYSAWPPNPPRGTPDTEDPVIDLEPLDGRADRFDLSRQLGAEDPLLRPEKAAEEAPQERLRRRGRGSRSG